MFSPKRINLGELSKKVFLERLERSEKSKVQLEVDKEGNEYIHIYGNGYVTSIPVFHEDRRMYEKNMRDDQFRHMLEFEQLIADEIEKKGFIDKESFHNLLMKHYKREV